MKVLVIQGAGMNMRGKVDIELFGSKTLEQVNDEIRGYAAEIGVEVDFFHSNIEGEVVNALYTAHDGDVDAVLINPAGFMRTTGPLPTAIGQVRFPVIEVHVSNPVKRGVASTTLPACVGSVTGFGPFSYSLALAAAKHIVVARRERSWELDSRSTSLRRDGSGRNCPATASAPRASPTTT